MRRLTDYAHLVGDEIIADIYRRAGRLRNKRLLHVNSTYTGGGVAEKLASLIPLLNDVGLDADWRILPGAPHFFAVTKKMHNGLQGDRVELTDKERAIYLKAAEDFSDYALIDHDCVVVHDPQPLPLNMFYERRQPWVWRCHVDLSAPDPALWAYLKGFVVRYDTVVVSHESYARSDLPVDQNVFAPAIDPLSPKNRELSDEEVREHLARFGVPTDKPLLVQVSRFDKWKDPEGVVDVFKLVRQDIDCRLVLCGGMASDDPEGWQIYEAVQRKAAGLIDAGDVILITNEDSYLVNALQRAAVVVIQKSVKEGFGLTVTEAMWKGRPVVSTWAGGIPLQIEDGRTGCLVQPDDAQAMARRVVELIKDPDKAHQLGAAARESARLRFLMPRLVADHVGLMSEVLS